MLPQSSGPVIRDAPGRPAFSENLGHSSRPWGPVIQNAPCRPAFSENLGHSNVTLTAAGGAFGHKDSPEPGAVPLPAFLKNLGHSNVTLTAAGGAACPRPPSKPPSINVRIAALRLLNLRAAAQAATNVGPPVRIAPKRVLFPRLPSTASKSGPFLRAMAMDYGLDSGLSG
jgi:hypothetical protein